MTNLISEADYLKALQSGHRRSFRELRAVAVAYNPDQDTVDIIMADGWRIQIDRAKIAEFAMLPPSALENLCLSPAGVAIELDAEDVHISLEGLLATIIPVKALARRAPAMKPVRKAFAD
jgi:Protein of unknown function (DUF2442)